MHIKSSSLLSRLILFLLSLTGRWRPRVDRRRITSSVYGAPQEVSSLVDGLTTVIFLAEMTSVVDYIAKNFHPKLNKLYNFIMCVSCICNYDVFRFLFLLGSSRSKAMSMSRSLLEGGRKWPLYIADIWKYPARRTMLLNIIWAGLMWLHYDTRCL